MTEYLKIRKLIKKQFNQPSEENLIDLVSLFRSSQYQHLTQAFLDESKMRFRDPHAGLSLLSSILKETKHMNRSDDATLKLIKDLFQMAALRVPNSLPNLLAILNDIQISGHLSTGQLSSLKKSTSSLLESDNLSKILHSTASSIDPIEMILDEYKSGRHVSVEMVTETMRCLEGYADELIEKLNAVQSQKVIYQDFIANIN